MSSIWYAAFGLLLLLTLVNAVALLAVMRQVGVLHQRIRPTGPGDHEGPGIGTRVSVLPFYEVPSNVALDPFLARVTVLGYVSPGCGLCDDLVEAVNAYTRDQPSDGVHVYLTTDAPQPEAERWVSNHDSQVPVLRAQDMARAYEIPGSPYVLALHHERDESATVLAAGVVNTLEQFEDLIEMAQVQLAERSGAGNGASPADGPPELRISVQTERT